MRSSWQIQQAVVKALFIRELKTRFGTSPFGYAWAIAGPFFGVMVMVVIFSTISRAGYQGIPFALFFTPGFLLLGFFTGVATGGSGAINGNKGLFNYKQVKPFDAFLTRTLLETVLLIVSMVFIYSAYAWYGYDVAMQDPLVVILVVICLSALGLGLSMCIGSLGLYFKDTDKIVSVLTRPLFFVSCVIYPLIVIPAKYHYLFLWNPLVHAIELMRVAWYPHYIAPGVDLMYLFTCSLGCLFLGMLSYRRNWQKMVAS